MVSIPPAQLNLAFNFIYVYYDMSLYYEHVYAQR